MQNPGEKIMCAYHS